MAALCAIGAGGGLIAARLCGCLHGGGRVQPWEVHGVGTVTRIVADSAIHCGQVLRDTTAGAPTGRYSTRDYERWICYPGVDDRDRGGERSYALDLGRHRAASVHLRPSYVDLDVAAVPAFDPALPPTGRPHGDCEVTFPTVKDLAISASVSTRWLLLVEGADGREGDFELEVTCDD